MTATAARPQRPIPTVQASPELLREGDMVYPDISTAPGYREVPDADPTPFLVLQQPDRVPGGWRIYLDGAGDLLVPADHKVRTQRRPNPGLPTPDEAWDAAAASYREPRYG